MEFVLVCLVLLVVLCILDKLMSGAIKESKQKKEWNKINRGICPWCGEKTVGPLTDIHCSKCSFTNTEMVSLVNGRCSFCGAGLTMRRHGEVVGHGKRKRTTNHTFLGCPSCEGWVEKPDFPKEMRITDGKCGFCQGPLKTIQEKKVEVKGNCTSTTFAIMECEDCGRTATDSPPPNPSSDSYDQDDSYDYRPYGIGSI